MSKTIGVRGIAYFIHSSGDLTNEFSQNKANTEGHLAHVYLQNKFSESSLKEYYVKLDISRGGTNYIINGFIDGVHKSNDEIIIEEIKSTKAELDEVSPNYHLEYMAQLKMYGYIYFVLNNILPTLRLTFISTINYDVKSFDFKLSKTELEDFFFDTLDQYLSFYHEIDKALENKINTIKTIKFPFEVMRKGQRDLMAASYQTMKQNDILYAIAPTGVGKTMATIFSALKTLDQKNKKLFYLTAKGMGKRIATNAVNILHDKGLNMKSIVLTAKSKICQQKIKNCNSDSCPFAKGFFNRIRKAITDIFSYDGIYDMDTILEYANRHTVCAFEFSLELSNYCDLIIADYNYIFDPKAHLIRYVDESTYELKVLVDEAHNLIDRSKEMYSASISTQTLKDLRLKLTGLKPSVRKNINDAIEVLEKYDSLVNEQMTYHQDELNKELIEHLNLVSIKCEQIFVDNKEFDHKDEALSLYYEIYDFLMISDLYSNVHKTLVTKTKNDNFYMDLKCFNASNFLYKTIKESLSGIVFFSATLFPIKYHMDLLTGGVGKYLSIESPFDKSNLGLFINPNISTKYIHREASVDQIIDTIDILTDSKVGNYIIFFPSYNYLNMVYEKYKNEDIEIIVQTKDMTESDRDEIFNKFYETKSTKIGFFVMGGVFSEGLDYIGDLLSGVIIVGVGIPQVCLENDLAKEFFDETYHSGFDYAYTYPGFNKVVQAAGRVIRSETDKGVVILLDSRYKYLIYQNIMPNFWSERIYLNSNLDLKNKLKDFWNKK